MGAVGARLGQAAEVWVRALIGLWRVRGEAWLPALPKPTPPLVVEVAVLPVNVQAA